MVERGGGEPQQFRAVADFPVLAAEFRAHEGVGQPGVNQEPPVGRAEPVGRGVRPLDEAAQVFAEELRLLPGRQVISAEGGDAERELEVEVVLRGSVEERQDQAVVARP